MNIVVLSDALNIDRNELESCDRYIRSIVGKLHSKRLEYNTGFEYEDLYQIGLVALVKAIKMYTPNKGIERIAYVLTSIRNEIMKEIRRNGQVHVGRDTKKYFYKALKEGILNEHEDVIAEKLSITKKQVRLVKMSDIEIQSIHRPVKSKTEEITLEDVIADDVTAADIAEARVLLQQFLSTLTDRERKVWEAYRNGDKQEQIGKAVGISQPHVHRIIQRIFQKAEKFGKDVYKG